MRNRVPVVVPTGPISKWGSFWNPDWGWPHLAFNTTLLFPWLWNSSCFKSSAHKLSNSLSTDIHKTLSPGPGRVTRVHHGRAQRVPSTSRKGRYLQGHGPLTLVQHLNWCLLTTAFLIAYLSQSKEIAAYNRRKSLSDSVWCGLWVSKSRHHLAVSKDSTKLAGESSSVAISL